MTDTCLPLIVGIGNPYRCDDRAGLEAARRIQSQSGEGLEVLQFPGEPMTLLDLWEGRQRVFLIDAVASAEKPGTLHVLDAVHQPLPLNLFNTSTHNMSVADTIELARTLGRLPGELWLYGIVGQCFQYGEDLSPAVENAIDRVVDAILSLKK
jgi:hydrogenase maturation protease